MATLSMFHSLLQKAKTLLPHLDRSSSPSSSSCVHVVTDLKKLERRMRRIHALLSDAEEREIREVSVRLWLDELRRVAYDADDLLEEVEYELVLRHELVLKKQKYGFTTHEERPVDRKFEDTSFLQEIVDRLVQINNRFSEIYDHRIQLQLIETYRDDDHMKAVRPPTGPLIDVLAVYGREDDVREIIRMLSLDDDDDDDVDDCNNDGSYSEAKNVGIISIVGMGGLGKTTLAQQVYNDDRVSNHFQKKAWVHVSDSFDVTKVTRAIIEAIRGRTCELQSFSSLQLELRKELKEKKFFLVLDDVWNESMDRWEALMRPLSKGAKGSKLLITTRNERVSRISRGSDMYKLGCLSDEDSWSLFKHKAFGGEDNGSHRRLVEIGQKIVQKCKGLPLALKTLASSLFCEFSEDRWEDVLRSELWDLAGANEDIVPALKLSYHYLPSHIKPCFAYCAVFPKGHEFYKDELVWTWMAQGYITPARNQCMEDAGTSYFNDLLQRSFFQKDQNGFKMHDLVHDLASSVCGSQCCVVADDEVVSDATVHVSFGSWEDIMRMTSLSGGRTEGLDRWRTFTVLSFWGFDRVGTDVMDALFTSMRHLRVLDLLGSHMTELPDSVGNLKHLRYLSLNGWWYLRKLPESLGNLLNLQSLQLGECRDLGELPEHLTDLLNLRHLVLPRDGNTLSKMPGGFGRLTKLQMLPLFVVGEGPASAGIEQLTGLNDLRGELKILVKTLNNYNGKQAILNNKRHLESLTLEFACSYWMQQEKDQEDLLESVQAHTNIKKLDIVGYGGYAFPEWIGDPSYSRLEQIHLTHCHNCEEFSVGTNGGGTCLRLNRLRIEHCPRLKCVKLWQLAALRELTIGHCEELTTLDYCYDHVSSTMGLSRSQQRRGVNCPTGIQTMRLLHCPKLDFLTLRQQLPPSLQRLDVAGSRRMEDWVRKHKDKLQRIGSLYMTDDTRGPLLLLRDLKDLEEEWVKDLHNDGTIEQVQSLELQWNVEQESLSPEKAETLLREITQLPFLLGEGLVIRGYRGRSFPRSIDDPIFLGSLKKMALSDSAHCERLPSLGRLPNLKDLHISSVGEVRHVGPEFCGAAGSGRAFQSLETLKFENMPRWEAWERVEDGGAFPRLRVLRIVNCPNLRTLQLMPPPRRAPASSWQTLCFNALSELHISDLPCLESIAFPFWTTRDSPRRPIPSMSITWASTGSSRPRMPCIQMHGFGEQRLLTQ